MTSPVVVCTGLGVRFDDTEALASVDLAVRPGELLAVLGPSGSGKTTLLHAIAGFVPVDAGSIAVGGRVVAEPGVSVTPEERRVGVVFQHHALWPHLTVAETVAFPLRFRGVPAADRVLEVGRLLERLGIAHLGDRRPDQLSGGEQQRVSLARALARRPAVFLFDEPTAHLDAPLRRALLEEINAQRLRDATATIYATHDASEALAIADRVLVLRDGRAVQVGSPIEIYEQPVDRWAAEMTGPASGLISRWFPPARAGRRSHSATPSETSPAPVRRAADRWFGLNGQRSAGPSPPPSTGCGIGGRGPSIG